MPRKTSGLSRKPLLSKSNTLSPRRTDLRTTKTRGGDQDAQENFVRRLCQINAMSPLSRKSAEAPGQLETGLPYSLHRESNHGRQNENGKTEDMSSPRASEAGSDASRRVSEIATDAGPDTMSDFSDADEFRSVSSEPISKLTSISKRNSLRTETSKMSLLSGQSGPSFFTAGSWDSDHSRSMNNNAGRGDIPEVIFPEFSEGSNFLVGDTDALDLSFLHAGAADPEVIVNGKDYERKEFDVMDSPMARDYVTYNRGSETDITENCIDSNRVAIAEWNSDQGENLGNMGNSGATEMSVDAADKERDSTTIIPPENTESKQVDEGTESKLSCSGIMHSDHGEPIPADAEDGPEIHSELPCLESNSPPFDAKDYKVAKKLVFEPEEITETAPLQQSEYDPGGKEVDGSNFQNSEEEQGPVTSVPKTIEAKDFASHSLDEPAMNSQHGDPAEIVSETPPPTIENTDGDHGECNSGHRIVEQDVTNNIDQEGSISETVSETPPPTIENTSSDGDHGERISEHRKVEQDITNNIDQEGGITSVEEAEAPAIDCEHDDAGTSSAGQQQKSELADTRVPSEGVDSFETEDQDISTLESIERHMSQPQMEMNSEFEAPAIDCNQNDAVTPSAGHQQESELADTRVPSEDIDLFETEDQDTSTVEIIERHVSQSQMDMFSVAPTNDVHSDSSLTKNWSGNATSELDRSSSPADEEEGLDVKARDGQASPTNGIHSDSSLTKNLSGNATPELDRSNSPADDEEGLDVKVRDGQAPPTNGLHSDPSLTKKLSDNATSEMDRSNSPAHEQEGLDVKARDGQCASTSTIVIDYNKVRDVESLN